MDVVVVPLTGDEKTMLLAVLDAQRAAILRKVEGLTEAQARERLVPSLTTLGGMVKHLAAVERFWVQRTFAGEELPVWRTREDADLDWRIDDSDRLDLLVAAYEAVIGRNQAICHQAGSLDEIAARQIHGSDVSLRWIVAHLIEETARHAGHADILREQLDGSAGG